MEWKSNLVSIIESALCMLIRYKRNAGTEQEYESMDFHYIVWNKSTKEIEIALDANGNYQENWQTQEVRKDGNYP